jgi:hypothetical protein
MLSFLESCGRDIYALWKYLEVLLVILLIFQVRGVWTPFSS